MWIRVAVDAHCPSDRPQPAGDERGPVAAAPALRRVALPARPHKAGSYQQKLFDNPHVCLLRRGHPAGPRLTLKAFLAADHAVVRLEGREHVFEQFMQQRGLQRRVVLELSHCMSLLPVLENSDLVATVPRDLADVCVRYAKLQTVATPLKAPVIAVQQFWHERFHKDPANVWLRELVREEFKADRRDTSAPGRSKTT